jgi:hypothetical protein
VKSSVIKLIGWWPVAILTAPLAVYLTLRYLFGLQQTTGWQSWMFPAGQLLALVGCAFIVLPLRGRAKRAQGELCIHCRYVLTDLQSPGTCPECGKPFPADRHASVWRSAGFLG